MHLTLRRYLEAFSRADNVCLIVHSTYWDQEVWHKVVDLTFAWMEEGLRWQKLPSPTSPSEPDEVVLVERTKPLDEFIRSAMGKIRCNQIADCHAFCITDISWHYYLRPLSSDSNQWWLTNKNANSHSSDFTSFIPRKKSGFDLPSFGGITGGHIGAHRTHQTQQVEASFECYRKVIVSCKLPRTQHQDFKFTFTNKIFLPALTSSTPPPPPPPTHTHTHLHTHVHFHTLFSLHHSLMRI
jgi:hypothetical protein